MTFDVAGDVGYGSAVCSKAPDCDGQFSRKLANGVV